MLDTANLPNDINALKAIIMASQGRIARLEMLVTAFKKVLFGRKSEKLDPDQFELALEDIETAIAKTEAERDADDLSAKTSEPTEEKKPRAANRGALPKHLARIEEIIEPESTLCPCGGDLHVIGEDVSERLDVVPAQFRVIVTRRPKYACRNCEDGITQAPAPAHVIRGGLPTEALIAHVLVSKFADHSPLYRQAQIYSRQGIDLDRSTLAGWVGKAAFELKPVFDCLLKNLKTSTKLYMDETRAPVLDPGKRKIKTGYFWALARDDRPWRGDDPPGVVYTYAPGRSGKFAETILEDFGGILQVDGYGGYNRLADQKRKGGPIRLAYCWAHARRKLYEVAQHSTSPIAEEGLKRIAELYEIEVDIRGQSAADRLSVRIENSAPLIENFKQWLDQNLAQVSGKSPLGQALRYIAKFWNGLTLFLSDGRIEMDNNAVERSIRPIALNRKNALFAGHDAGAENWGIIASLIETAKLNNVEPYAWLTATLKAIMAGHMQSQIEQLLPWNYEASANPV